MNNLLFKLPLIFLCFLPLFVVLSQEINPQDVADYRVQLEAELAELEQLISAQQELIVIEQRKATTLERDIAILDAQINKMLLEIRARNLAIEKLNTGIGQKTQIIGDLEKKIISEKQSLSELLRKVNEMDSTSLVEIVLGYDRLSDFFEDFSSFESIQKELQISLGDIRDTYTRTENEKQDLENRKTDELELRYLQRIEKASLESKEAEKKRLLTVTKGQEETYQKILVHSQKTAAEIRSQLFLLRGSPAIPFEKAVEYANEALNATGVRPAFLLAIITQETELGANIGQCNLPDDPPKYKWQNIMKPSRDIEPYIEITGKLGLDPDLMPLSCPQAGGWGGAMGPAQFIPSTWKDMENKIAQLTGHNPPNPWDPYDAFMASALLLKDNGAAAGGPVAERKAALRYFAGDNWNNPRWAFYGDHVMEIAENYQKQIDIISNE